MGRDSLPANYSMTSVLFQTAIRAVDRLVDDGRPFLLSLQMGAPVSTLDGLSTSFRLFCEFSFHEPSNLSQTARLPAASSVRQLRGVHESVLLQP
jgi:hypothetical protein